MWTWPIAYERTPPKIDATPLPANQMQLLRACSEGVYHMPTTIVKPGLIALSNTPSNTRSVVMPAKLDAAAWHVKMIAQVILRGLAATTSGIICIELTS